MEERDAWTAARLEPLLARLEILVLRRHDLELFRDVVPQQERSSLDPMASAKGAVSSLAAHIVAGRGRASGSGFRGSEAERQRNWGVWNSFPAAWPLWRRSSPRRVARASCPCFVERWQNARATRTANGILSRVDSAGMKVDQ